MPLLSATDPLPYQPNRILVGGPSGAGKTTLARQIAATTGLTHTELDSLHHGPGWTARPDFVADVEAVVGGECWVTEYQYSSVRPLLLARCDLVVYLLLPRWRVMTQVIGRTLRRSLRREPLWNGNREPPLRTFFTDRDHIVRWAWRAHRGNAARLAGIHSTRPEVPIVLLHSRREVARWLGELAWKSARR